MPEQLQRLYSCSACVAAPEQLQCLCGSACAAVAPVR